MQGTVGVWGAQGLMEDMGTKPGTCGWSQELPVTSLAQAGHPARVVPSPLRALGLGQRDLIRPSMASLCSQNGAAQPGLGKRQSWV